MTTSTASMNHPLPQARPLPTPTAAAALVPASDRRRRLLLLGGGAGLAFLLLAFFSSEDGPVLCPFRRCTGGYCPGCGMTRSGGRLLRGDLAGSWEHHPFLVLAATQLAVLGALFTIGTSTVRRRLKSWWRPIAYANIGLIFAIWLARLVEGAIPAPFAG